jgi:hypothetical protein
MSGDNGMDYVLECIMSGTHGSYCYIPMLHVLKTNATRGPKRTVLIHSGGAPGHA